MVFFKGMPDAEIFDGVHHYMTVKWEFIVTFGNDGVIILLFNDNTNPLLSAQVTQCLIKEGYKFRMDNNYYYSELDKTIYHG